MSIRTWRLSSKKYFTTALSGYGSYLLGGRWNLKGTNLVYTSSNLALAQLEFFVHCDDEDAPEDIISIAIDIPNDVLIQTLENIYKLPIGWRDTPPNPELAKIGTEWVNSKTSLIMKIPSAVVIGEYNYLINPKHKDFSKLILANPEPVVFDKRLFASK